MTTTTTTTEEHTMHQHTARLEQVIGYVKGRKTERPEGLQFATEAPEVGQVAWAHGRGGWRRGVVVKVTPTKAFIEYLTQGGLDDAAKTNERIASVNVEARLQDAAATARRNFQFYVQETGPGAKYAANRDADEMARFQAIVDSGEDAEVERRVALERQRMADNERRLSQPLHALATVTTASGAWTKGEIGTE